MEKGHLITSIHHQLIYSDIIFHRYAISHYCKACIKLEIEIEIELEFNQLEKRKPISSLANFVLIGQNPIQSQSQSLV